MKSSVLQIVQYLALFQNLSPSVRPSVCPLPSLLLEELDHGVFLDVLALTGVLRGRLRRGLPLVVGQLGHHAEHCNNNIYIYIKQGMHLFILSHSPIQLPLEKLKGPIWNTIAL